MAILGTDAFADVLAFDFARGLTDFRICQRRGALSRFRSHGRCRFRSIRSEELAMKIAIGFVIALAAASLAGCVGYGYPGDYGYGGYPNGSYPGDRYQIGRAHVSTPVTNAQLVCTLLLAKQK